jgi:hypothetical protein
MCTVRTKQRLVVVEQKGKEFRLVNPNGREVVSTKVDGCAISSGLRCDHLLAVSDAEIFVELKGADIKHAADQICAAVVTLSKQPRSARRAAIVSSRVPRTDTSTMIAKARLSKHVAAIHVKNFVMEMTV